MGGALVQVTGGVITAAMPPHRAWKGRPWGEFVREVNAITITNLTKEK